MNNGCDCYSVGGFNHFQWLAMLILPEKKEK